MCSETFFQIGKSNPRALHFKTLSEKKVFVYRPNIFLHVPYSLLFAHSLSFIFQETAFENAFICFLLHKWVEMFSKVAFSFSKWYFENVPKDSKDKVNQNVSSLYVKSRKFYKGEQIWSHNPPACRQYLNFGLNWPG